MTIVSGCDGKTMSTFFNNIDMANEMTHVVVLL
jgi:hypothetical protein